MDANEIKATVRAYIVESFLMGGDGAALRDDASLLEEDVLDSTGVLELVAFLEERYGVAVADEELLPENLDSLDAIAAYVLRKAAGAPAVGAA